MLAWMCIIDKFYAIVCGRCLKLPYWRYFSHSAVKCFSLPAILVEQIFGKFGKEVSERLVTFTGVTVLVWSSLFSGEERIGASRKNVFVLAARLEGHYISTCRIGGCEKHVGQLH